MKVVVQRSQCAKLSINDEVYSETGYGMVILVGFKKDDTVEILDYMAKKVINLRIFDDDSHIMNKSVMDINGEILSVSQFTLYGNAMEGNRPSYSDAMNGDTARKYYDYFNDRLKEYGIKVKTGVFGADMKVELSNDGPVTIIIEKEV